MPLLLVVTALVKVSSPGTAIHRARRVGHHGKPFDLYKFRSMSHHLEASAPLITRAGDPRVTPLGRLLRRYKLDELPQFLNVLKGDMTLVGPRPEDPKYVDSYDTEQRKILAVRPGITGAASLKYRREEQELVGPDWEQKYVCEIMPEKLRIDLEYESGRTFISDLKLITATAVAILCRN